MSQYLIPGEQFDLELLGGVAAEQRYFGSGADPGGGDTAFELVSGGDLLAGELDESGDVPRRLDARRYLPHDYQWIKGNTDARVC